MKTCFFIGHRDAPGTIMPEVLAAVKRHVTEYGVKEFAAGRYGNFDAMAALAVKKVYPADFKFLREPFPCIGSLTI